MAEPSLNRETQEQPLDSGLRCPTCEYNLTGVIENRCPECGKAFDPARLQAILAGAPAPIPIWEDPSIHVSVRFIRICLLTWFAPHKLSRSFPRRYDFRSARRFRRWALLIALLISITPVALSLNIGSFWSFIVGLGGCVAGIFICEALLTVALGALLWPSETPPSTLYNLDASESFAGLVGMFRSFVILEALVAACGITGDILQWRLLSVAARLPLFIVALWWWVAVAAAVSVQPGGREGKLVAITAVPVIVLLSLFVALACGFLVFVTLGTVLSIFR